MWRVSEFSPFNCLLHLVQGFPHTAEIFLAVKCSFFEMFEKALEAVKGMSRDEKTVSLRLWWKPWNICHDLARVYHFAP
jgi:hypothetical protein